MKRFDFLKLLGLTALAPGVIGDIDTFKPNEKLNFLDKKLTVLDWLNKLPSEIVFYIKDINERSVNKIIFEHECQNEDIFLMMIIDHYYNYSFELSRNDRNIMETICYSFTKIKYTSKRRFIFPDEYDIIDGNYIGSPIIHKMLIEDIKIAERDC